MKGAVHGSQGLYLQPQSHLRKKNKKNNTFYVVYSICIICSDSDAWRQTSIIFISQLRTLRCRAAKQLAQGHTANKKQSWDSNLGDWLLSPRCSHYLPMEERNYIVFPFHILFDYSDNLLSLQNRNLKILLRRRTSK